MDSDIRSAGEARSAPLLLAELVFLAIVPSKRSSPEAKRNNTPVCVGYTQRFRKRYLLAKQSVVAGNLGDVIMALGKIYVTRAVGEAVARRSPNTTPSINTLTYMVDLILWYMEG